MTVVEFIFNKIAWVDSRPATLLKTFRYRNKTALSSTSYFWICVPEKIPFPAVRPLFMLEVFRPVVLPRKSLLNYPHTNNVPLPNEKVTLSYFIVRGTF